ncbi:MAG: galactokinase [Capsulimonadaceae bacterium]|nr:galactokinase [Capsulimonadaceae bacterium]
MSDPLKSSLIDYQKRFGAPASAAAEAPGRVEILGNHTDYNGGLVLAAALDRVTAIVGSRRDDGKIVLVATDLKDEATFDAASFQADKVHSWASYVLGVVDQLRKLGVTIGGFQAVIESNVPVGAGLSSSAALEVSTALLLKQLYPYEIEKMELAKLCQRAENQFVGVSSGLLDQFSSTFGAKNSLVFLDCRSFDHGTVSLGQADVSLVICNSMASHSLTSGHYNERRAECEEAGAHFGKKLLRDVDPTEFERRKGELSENARKRAEHVFGENQRVRDGIGAAKASDLSGLGAAMSGSHESSRTLFENSTLELDFLVATAQSLPGCYGARLTGGGWGGATVNLVRTDAVDEFRTELSVRYKQHTGKTPDIFVCAIGDGAHIASV